MNKLFSRFSFPLRPLESAIFLGILLLGLFLRFTDLTDPPLDYHAMRQYRGALIARSMYYQVLPNARLTGLAKAHKLGVTR